MKKAFRLLVENPRHPGLRVKHMKGTASMWEARVSRSCRMTFEIRGGTYLLRNAGEHDETLGPGRRRMGEIVPGRGLSV